MTIDIFQITNNNMRVCIIRFLNLHFYNKIVTCQFYFCYV